MEKLFGLPGDDELTCVVKLGAPEGEVTPPKKRSEFSRVYQNKF
jgi:hypothetical protein